MAPIAISANKLYYQFIGDHVSDQIRKTFRVKNNDIWWRRRSGEAADDHWLPVVNSDVHFLLKWMRDNNFLGFKKVKTPKVLQECLDKMLKIGRSYDPTVMILSAVWIALVMRFICRFLKVLSWSETERSISKKAGKKE